MEHFTPCKTTFDQWAKNGKAEGMETGHWPAVRQAFSHIPDQDGLYLEIGCGNGYGVRYMATHQFRNGSCTGLDIAPQMIVQAKDAGKDTPNTFFYQANFLDWTPSENQTFGAVFSMEVFYYFPDIQEGLAKAASLLAPGGQLFVLVDFYKENEESHSWPKALNVPMQLWSKEDYTRGFDAAGLTNIQQAQYTYPDHKDTWKRELGTLATWGVKP